MTASKQQIFDQACAGVLRQGCASMVMDAFCAYRGYNGTKCAIGHCIPDDLYQPGMENKAPEQLLRDYPELTKILGKDIHFLYALQRCHDQASNLSDDSFRTVFKRKARDLAAEYSLNTDVLDNAH